MKIDISVAMLDLRGEPIKDGEIDVTLKAIACNALLSPYPDEKELDTKEKLVRYKLAMKITDANGEADLTVEEVASLKKLIGKAYPPLIVGRAFEILDPSD